MSTSTTTFKQKLQRLEYLLLMKHPKYSAYRWHESRVELVQLKESLISEYEKFAGDCKND